MSDQPVKDHECQATGNRLPEYAGCVGTCTLCSDRYTPETWLSSDRERNRLKKMLSVVVLLI